jgi:hypothetical protein
MLSPGRHAGFHAFLGNRIGPKDEMPMENMDICISQPSFQDPPGSLWNWRVFLITAEAIDDVLR